MKSPWYPPSRNLPHTRSGNTPFNQTSPNSQPIERNAFVKCKECDGMGFTATGIFANRKFDKCEKCNGAGQIYLK